MHAFDRRTDGRTEFSSLDRVCIPCSAVKIGLDDDEMPIREKQHFVDDILA